MRDTDTGTDTVIVGPFTVKAATYDPIRRTGFLKVEVPRMSENVAFYLNMIPDPLHASVVAASKRLNEAKKRRAPPEEFQPLVAEIRAMVVGQSFTCMMKLRPGAKHVPKIGSFRILQG